jgi:YjbR
MRFPEVEEGIACKGTAIECVTFHTRKKTFLFVGKAELRLKLDESLAMAAKLAKTEPERFVVGGTAWIKVTFSPDSPPPLDILERWIDESYRLIAPKQLVEMLPAGETSREHRRPEPATKKSAKKKPAR